MRLNPITDALSVNVEDYFHVEAFANLVRPENWPTFAARVHANCERILELFAKYDWRATFFVLGWVAERDPAWYVRSRSWPRIGLPQLRTPARFR